MNWHYYALGAIVISGLLATFSSTARAGSKEDGDDYTASMRSIANILDEQASDEALHVIYIHGMRAEGPGAALGFRKRLCEFLNGSNSKCDELESRSERKYLDIVSGLEDFEYLGQKIWKTVEETKNSRPFVDRFLIKSDIRSKLVVVDEYNWWPLLFPLKCRFILQPDSQLSGSDVDHLSLCAKSEEPYYPWITKEELEKTTRRPPIFGNGAWLNRKAKQEIINWGMADAVIATGDISDYLHAATDAAFEYATKADGNNKSRYIVIAESLGSFVVLDSIIANKKHVEKVISETQDIYFFANQVALLELSRIAMPSTQNALGLTDESSNIGNRSLFSALSRFASQPKSGFDENTQKNVVQKKQVIAFSDPSDLLTYRVPKISGWVVANVYVNNSWGFLGLFKEPTKAHIGHVNNKYVLDILFRKAPPQP